MGASLLALAKPIYYKLDKYIQPDCITTNQPSQTELSKCHDREER